jgi:23S rRNA pseudouridine2605 synthase
MLQAGRRVFSDLLKLATETQEALTLKELPRVRVVGTPGEVKLPEGPTSVRLSKRMSSSGICSRRQAERLIASGLVKVDSQRVSSNLSVSPQSHITIASNPQQPSTTVPIPEISKLWLFYKPWGLITSHSDPMGRSSVFDYLRKTKQGFEDKHVISVGRLDFMSEGLLLLTNNGDLSQALERSSLAREYRVRAYGHWTDEVLAKMRAGVSISGINYKPMNVQIDRKQTSNTWFRTELREGKNREIRRIFEHFHLRVNRLVRTRYGSYCLDGLRPGDIREAPILPEVHQAILMHFKRTAQVQTSGTS